MIRSRGTDSTIDPAYLADAPKVTTFIEELPPVTVEDNGSVLSVVDGAWNKAAPVEELPAVTAENNGEILTVVEGIWDKAEPTKELPTVTSEDNGDVLTVVDGVWNKVLTKKAQHIQAASGDTVPTGANIQIVMNGSYVEGNMCHVFALVHISAGVTFNSASGQRGIIVGLPKAVKCGGNDKATPCGVLRPIGYDNNNEISDSVPILAGGMGMWGEYGLMFAFPNDPDLEATYTVAAGQDYFLIDAHYFIETT